jgi:hypothetical protein
MDGGVLSDRGLIDGGFERIEIKSRSLLPCQIMCAILNEEWSAWPNGRRRAMSIAFTDSSVEWTTKVVDAQK